MLIYSLNDIQDPNNLDLEALLRNVIRKHTWAILRSYQYQLQRGPARAIFSGPGVVTLVNDGAFVFRSPLLGHKLTWIFQEIAMRSRPT